MQLCALQAARAAAVAGDHDARGDDCDDPRRVHDVRREIRTVGQDERDQDLELRLAHEAEDDHRHRSGR